MESGEVAEEQEKQEEEVAGGGGGLGHDGRGGGAERAQVGMGWMRSGAFCRGKREICYCTSTRYPWRRYVHGKVTLVVLIF